VWRSPRITAAPYRQVLVQEYTFSPQGATFSTKSCGWNSRDHHLSLTIVPNKSGSGVATLTALRLFA